MRTTITLDERLAAQTRARARELEMSVSAFIAKTLDDALKSPSVPEKRPFRLVTVGGRRRPGVDLDQPRAIETLDDVETFGR